MSFGDRLKERREELNLKQSDLGRLLGVTGSAIGNYENGVSSPKADILYRVFDVLKCDANFLFQDEIKSLTAEVFTSSEKELIKKYRNLDDHGRRMVKVVLEEEASREESEKVTATNIVYMPLPCSIQKASAGTGIYLGPEEFETIFVQKNSLTERASFAVTVSGDSMEPKFSDGDILLVAGRENVDIGQIGIFTVDGEGYVKKRGESELLSYNPKYNPIPLTPSSWCHGLVIGKLDPKWIKN